MGNPPGPRPPDTTWRRRLLARHQMTETITEIDVDGDGRITRLDLIMAKTLDRLPEHLIKDDGGLPFPTEVYAAVKGGMPNERFEELYLATDKQDTDGDAPDDEDDVETAADSRAHRIRLVRSHGTVTPDTLRTVAGPDGIITHFDASVAAAAAALGSTEDHAAHALLDHLDRDMFPVDVAEVWRS